MELCVDFFVTFAYNVVLSKGYRQDEHEARIEGRKEEVKKDNISCLSVVLYDFSELMWSMLVQVVRWRCTSVCTPPREEFVVVLKGKGTRTRPQHIPSTVKVVLPSYIFTEHQDITLTADLFAVNGNLFLHTKSRMLHFRTAVAVQDRTKATIPKHIKPAIALHNTRSFVFNELIADNVFECIKDDIIPVLLNLVARGKHYGIIESYIKFLKERLCCLWNGLSFPCVPRIMITTGIAFCIDMINTLPAGDGISNTLSPATIVTGREPPNVANL